MVEQELWDKWPASLWSEVHYCYKKRTIKDFRQLIVDLCLHIYTNNVQNFFFQVLYLPFFL